MQAFNLFKDPKNIALLRKRVPERHSIKALSNALVLSVKKNSVGLKKCAVLFSGGIDSSLIAFVLKDFVEGIQLYCAGLEGSKSLVRAKENAELLGLELHEVPIEKEEIPKLLDKTRTAINSSERLQLQIALPAFAAMEAIKNASIEAVFSGTGADELFCGYREFNSVLENSGYKGVEELIWKKLAGMHERNLKRELALAKHFSLDLRAPFLEEEFLLQAMAFPARKKIHSASDGLRKHALRELAFSLGLPEKICKEKKKAIQFDSGIAREMRKIFELVEYL